MRGPEGYYKSADCRAQKFYVCQNDADFSSPPQGAWISFPNIFICPNVLTLSLSGYFGIYPWLLESYIYSPDYLNSYPNSYEQVNKVDQTSHEITHLTSLAMFVC